MTIGKFVIKKPRRQIIKDKIINNILPKMNMTDGQILEHKEAIEEFSDEELEEYMGILEDRQNLEIF